MTSDLLIHQLEALFGSMGPLPMRVRLKKVGVVPKVLLHLRVICKGVALRVMQREEKSPADAREPPEEMLPPGQNPRCKCHPLSMQPMFCPYGHMTECHYPFDCEEAQCSHFLSETEVES